MKKDFSKFKVLGITLLVTMSSCVPGSFELNAEALRTYGLEFDISTSDKYIVVEKNKRTKNFSGSKFILNNIIESGRNHFNIAGFSIDYTPFVFHLRYELYQLQLVNKLIFNGRLYYSESYRGINFQNRAGPFLC